MRDLSFCFYLVAKYHTRHIQGKNHTIYQTPLTIVIGIKTQVRHLCNEIIIKRLLEGVGKNSQ